MTVYFSDNLFDFSYNLEFFIFHFLFLFFFQIVTKATWLRSESPEHGSKANAEKSVEMDFS